MTPIHEAPGVPRPRDRNNGKRYDKPYCDRLKIPVHKISASSVPYGESISRNGKTLWAVLDNEGNVVAAGATADEARRKYKAWVSRGSIVQGSSARS